MTAPELKPCPFCGAVDPEWLASHVVCDCGATGPRQDVDREYQADAMRALTDWNRRADLAAVQPALDKLIAEAVGPYVEALRVLISHTHECERELTEALYHADFCGESRPLTDARALLAASKKGGV